MRELLDGGAVGLGLASCLLKSEAEVEIMARDDTVKSLKKYGLVRTGIFGDFRADPSAFGSYPSLEQVHPGTCDYVVVCTKSFDSYEAAMDLSGHKSLFSGNTKIVLFQNGWGNAEASCCFFEKEEIYNARVITGFQRQKPNEVKVTVHAEAIHIGSLFGESLTAVEDLCESINKGDIPCRPAEEIGKDIWAKMLYNCDLNPLGAILDVQYGTLAEYESTRKIMNGIVCEVFGVMTSASYQTHWLDVDEFLAVFYGKLVPDTAEHKSSTLQDIAAQKRTEIYALNGAVVKLAAESKIDVPYNSVVYDVVKFIEDKGRSNLSHKVPMN